MSIANGAGSGVAVFVIGVVGVILYEISIDLKFKSAQRKYVHLDGKHKIGLISLPRPGEMIAEVTYTGAFEGSFDIDKIYMRERPTLDVWESLSMSEQSDIHREIREHFSKMRKER